MIYKVKRKVTGSMVDTKANLSLLGLCDVIVDTMSEMLGLLKLDGLYALKNYNAMWVISKNKIRIFDEAKWNEKLEVESFISSTTLARITIDTVIKKLDKMVMERTKQLSNEMEKNTGLLNKVIDLERKKKVLYSNELYTYDNVESINQMILDNIIFDNTLNSNVFNVIDSLNIKELKEILKNIDLSNYYSIIIKKK